jgi:predicted transcriptional regulator
LHSWQSIHTQLVLECPVAVIQSISITEGEKIVEEIEEQKPGDPRKYVGRKQISDDQSIDLLLDPVLLVTSLFSSNSLLKEFIQRWTEGLEVKERHTESTR